jgi:CheY-like chemotaxis protein
VTVSPQATILSIVPNDASHKAGKKAGAVSRSGKGVVNLSVLIVDDMSETRELFCLYFEMQGVRVRLAADGVAALRAILAERPDVIVLDLAMPRMTGWEFIRLMRQDERLGSIPVVTLSGQSARESALQAGANAYLEKPCLPADVLAEVLRVAEAAQRESR